MRLDVMDVGHEVPSPLQVRNSKFNSRSITTTHIYADMFLGTTRAIDLSFLISRGYEKTYAKYYKCKYPIDPKTQSLFPPPNAPFSRLVGHLRLLSFRNFQCCDRANRGYGDSHL
jgi:hypothetical protein